jgi:AcrR family transcriptional regulator
MSTSPSAYDRILVAASDLFYHQGIHAVGVEAIAQAAGVAKTTLYYHFPSKDDLIVAYLDLEGAQFWSWFNDILTHHPDDPYEQLLDIFRALAEQEKQERCLGCPFLNTAAEFMDREYAGHQRAITHKRQVHARLAELAQQANLRDPSILAEHLLLLMDGAFAAQRLYGPGKSAVYVVGAAEILMQAANTPH